MADKSFGVKQLNLIGASGTPTIESPNNLNINATTVAISTDLTVGGQIQSNFIVGNSYYVGIGTTNPIVELDVVGGGNFTGILTAASFSGTISTAAFASTAFNLTNAANILDGTIDPARLSGEYNIDISGQAYRASFAETLENAANIITGTIEPARLTGVYDIDISGTANTATNVIGGIASVTSLSVSGISTLGNVRISSGIVTASTGIVTYYGDGSKLTNVVATGTGVTISRNGNILGVSTNFNFQDHFNIDLAGGISTITVDRDSVNYFQSTATGIGTILNVGIGTTNATSKLTVDGDLRVTGSIIADLGISTANSLRLISPPVDTSSYLLFTSDAVAGVGTSVFTDSSIYWDNSSYILNLPTLQASSAINLNDNVGLYFGTSNDVSFAYDGISNDLEVQLNAAATKIAITDNGTYKHIITKTGKVGINTDVTPNVELFVNGSTNITGGINTIGNVKITSVGTGATIGAVGIITYYGDGRFLQNVSVGASAAGSDGQIQYNNGGTSLGGASQFYYDDNTNRVGIGTTNPIELLHVEGNVYISGILTAAQTVVGSATSAENIKVSTIPADTTTFPLFASASTSGISTAVYVDSDISWDAVSNILTVPSLTATTQVSLGDSDNLIFGAGSDAKIFYDGAGNILNIRLESTANSVIVTDAGTTKITLNKNGGAQFTGIVTATDFNSTSDIAYKYNVQTVENPLDKILQIRGVEFNWKSDDRKSIGVIAQEIEKTFPELIGGSEFKTVNYNGLIGILIEAVKELKDEVEQLKKKINN